MRAALTSQVAEVILRHRRTGIGECACGQWLELGTRHSVHVAEKVLDAIGPLRPGWRDAAD